MPLCPYALCLPCSLWFERRRLRAPQGIRGSTPFSGGPFSGQDEATDTRARELRQLRRDELAAPSLRVNQGSHRFCDVHRLDGPLAVVLVPGLKQPHDLATMRIISLDAVDPLDGIATAKREEWIAAPFGPLLEATERSTRLEVCSVLPTPPPDGQGRPKQLGSASFRSG